MPTYLDHNATTHLHPQVLDAMLPYLSGPSANASSLHRYGRIARDAVEQARVQVAGLLGCEAKEIVWTSGGTEANNLALKGSVAGQTPSRVLYGATDHPAVMEAAESLAAQGWTVEPIAVDGQGVIDWGAFDMQLSRGPVRLVSAMRANNETGVIQDVARLAQLAHTVGAFVHVDAVQAAGKIPVDIVGLDADLMSASAHKIYGPKGCGALVVRSHVELLPVQHGGAQERGMRGGTENVAAIVGFGAAAELAVAELEQRSAHTRALRTRLEAGLRARPDTLIFGGAAPEHVPNTLQFMVRGWDGEALLMALDRRGYAVSSGSACASGSGEPSHVLLAMGHDRVTAKGAIRVSFGRDNVEADVDGFLAALDRIIADGGA
ncbi:MAG: cysteine desulfurase [Panacagrimonas sp.]|jgi:cysteine desulfurase|nr:cysteine desulfurase family protein [Panacagrimonas sp.]MCC2657302.1 cysteine desulfurase [Panacagrimonas sp.]